MGAWIETLKVDPRILNPIVVAPYVGAWIETAVQEQMKHNQQVAPYVGAWIETKADDQVCQILAESHPTWVRGLKLRSI